MKVALINGILDPAKVGGAPISVINLAKQLSQRGHKVTMFSADKINIKKITNINSEKLIHISFSMLNELKFNSLIQNFIQAFYLMRYHYKTSILLKKNEYDIIDNHGFWCSNQDIITVRYSIEGYYNKCKDKLIPNKYKRGFISFFDLRLRLLKHIERNYYKKKRYNKIIAVSSKVKDELIEYHKVNSEDIIVINNSIDPKKFSKGKMNIAQLKRKYGIKDSKVISFIGNNLNRKNIELVYDIIRKINKYTIKLIIAGNDSIKVPDDIKTKIILLPWVKDIQEIYYISDIFLFPTLYDTCAKTVLEAMFCGCCVLTSYESGCSDFISNGKNGYILNNDDEYANILIHLLNHPENIKKIGRKASMKLRNSSWKKNCDKFIEVYSMIKSMKENIS